MNPTVTVFYDGLPKDINDFYRSPSSTLIPDFKKEKRRYWVTNDTIRGTEILVSNPMSEKDNKNIAAFNKILERGLDISIDNLVCVEISEVTSKQSLGEDAKKILEDLMRELYLVDKLYVVIEQGLDKIVKAEGEEISKILNSSEVSHPSHGRNI